jgi:hypothetical protein
MESIPGVWDCTELVRGEDDLTCAALDRQNRTYRGTKGVSQGNRDEGFEPAFRDRTSGMVYRSRFADGRPAPMHLLEGLPRDLAVSRDGSGKTTGDKSCVEAGFVRAGAFYTRDEAANELDARGR